MVKYDGTIIYTLNKRKESIIAFSRTLSKTKEAIHRGWCISIEWPIGRVSLMQVICWGMKLSAFYTRCERACNPCPSAQASGSECVTSLSEFQQVETPVCLFLSRSELASLNLFVHRNVASRFRGSIVALFLHEKGMWHSFSFRVNVFAYLWTFPS